MHHFLQFNILRSEMCEEVESNAATSGRGLGPTWALHHRSPDLRVRHERGVDVPQIGNSEMLGKPSAAADGMRVWLRVCLAAHPRWEDSRWVGGSELKKQSQTRHMGLP